MGRGLLNLTDSGFAEQVRQNGGALFGKRSGRAGSEARGKPKAATGPSCV